MRKKQYRSRHTLNHSSQNKNWISLQVYNPDEDNETYSERNKKLVIALENIRSKSENPINNWYHHILVNRIFEENLSLCGEHVERYRYKGIGQKDLSQEAMIGLFNSILEVKSKYELSTYSYKKIRGNILDAFIEKKDLEHPVHIPRLVHEKRETIENLFWELAKFYERLPTESEILEVYNSRLKDKSSSHLDIVDLNEINKSKRLNRNSKRLQAVHNDDKTDFYHLDNRNISQTLEKMHSLMSEEKGIINDQERTILLEHYGIECEEKTLKEIGKPMGLTKQRVSKIKVDALDKLFTAMKKESFGEH